MAPPADDGGTLIENYQLEVKLEGEEDWRVVLGSGDQFNLALEYTMDESAMKAGE